MMCEWEEEEGKWRRSKQKGRSGRAGGFRISLPLSLALSLCVVVFYIFKIFDSEEIKLGINMLSGFLVDDISQHKVIILAIVSFTLIILNRETAITYLGGIPTTFLLSKVLPFLIIAVRAEVEV